MSQRKLGRAADQRLALLRNQTTQFLFNGKIETTLARAKEIRSIAEKFITLAIRECDNTVEVTKTTNNEKGQAVSITVHNDLPSRLHARRQMMAYLYKLPAPKLKDENKSDYKKRTKDVANPVIEKLFREIGPKYKKRREEKGQGGGYTRILRMGPRRGDGAEVVILELV